MSKFTIEGGEGPKTQSIEAVKSLIEFVTGAKCQDLLAVVKLANGWQLTRSSKGDCYYVTSPKECSCPGFHYRRTCRHVAALAGQTEKVLPALLVDAYAFDTLPGEVDYWQKKEQTAAQRGAHELQKNIVEAMEA